MGCCCWTFGDCFEPKAPVLASEEASFFFHSLVLGTVVVLLVAVATVVSARDALKIMGTFTNMSTVTVTSTKDAFAIVAPLDDVVDLVT